jgi:hypothetical protein
MKELNCTVLYCVCENFLSFHFISDPDPIRLYFLDPTGSGSKTLDRVGTVHIFNPFFITRDFCQKILT